jgi:hypothetical protein
LFSRISRNQILSPAAKQKQRFVDDRRRTVNDMGIDGQYVFAGERNVTNDK